MIHCDPQGVYMGNNDQRAIFEQSCAKFYASGFRQNSLYISISNVTLQTGLMVTKKPI